MDLTIDAPTAAPRFRTAPSARSAAAERRRREHELRHALTGHELALHYAGRLSLDSGAMGGAEAIVRWPHRRRGSMPAADLMALAEGAGLVVQIGSWMLDEACAAAARWPGGAIVCIDLPTSWLEHDGLLEQVALALERSALEPERLEIELSETALDGALDERLLRLAALRDLGVGLALDEFGARAASLSMLKRLPLTTVKLDGSLLRNVASSREDRAILQAIIQAAHALDLVTVATGIETEDQRAVLAGMACDEGQGPLFGALFPPGWAGPDPIP